nr:hypothetical protein [Rhodoferax sp.]
MSRFVILTGLPASGKSSLGAVVAASFALPFFDKDEILESLFDTLGVGDTKWRTELSRAADLCLERLALRSNGAVIASWWQHPKSQISSGTPPYWLRSLPGEVVELHCECSPKVAVERFFARSRHAGHLDGEKTKSAELTKFEHFASFGCLGIGRVIELNTEQPVELGMLLSKIAPHGIHHLVTRPSTSGKV